MMQIKETLCSNIINNVDTLTTNPGALRPISFNFLELLPTLPNKYFLLSSCKSNFIFCFYFVFTLFLNQEKSRCILFIITSFNEYENTIRRNKRNTCRKYPHFFIYKRLISRLSIIR